MENTVKKLDIIVPDTYQELKAKHRKDVNDFEGIFFAFNDSQFKEGMEKMGLTVEDTSKIYSLGSGGFILKSRSADFNAMFERHAEENKKRRQDEKFLLEALTYELQNHEYCITYDPTSALEALGIDIEDIDPKIMKLATSAALVGVA